MSIGRRAFLLAPAASVAARAGVAGSPLLDAHAHVTSERLLAFRETRRPGDVRVGGAELIRQMDADGIRRAFVLSTAYQMAADYKPHKVSEKEEYPRVRGENDFAAAECSLDPERLIPFLSVNPKRAYAIEEIDRCVERHPMRGLKLHFWNSLVDTRDRKQLAQVQKVVAHAARRGLPVVAHIFVGDVPDYGPADTERFVREVIVPTPNLRISIAHLAGAGGFGEPAQRCFERLIELRDVLPRNRVWVDLAAILRQSPPPAVLEKLRALLTLWGVDRVFWGSDGLKGALEQTREYWPLTSADWDGIRQQDGGSFLAVRKPAAG